MINIKTPELWVNQLFILIKPHNTTAHIESSLLIAAGQKRFKSAFQLKKRKKTDLFYLNIL